MVRSVLSMLVGVTLLTAMAVRPLLHLHVARDGHHHHVEGVTHEHHAVVHAHGPGRRQARVRTMPVDGTDIRPHDHGGVVSIDTMQTDLPTTAKMFAVLETGTLLSVPDRVVDRHLLGEPRAHPPPGIVSAPSRAPPA